MKIMQENISEEPGLSIKKVAILCALPPNRNTGMATVDLAAFSAVKRLAPDVEVTLYAYGDVNPYTYQPGDLPYHYLNVDKHAERYLSSDIFIFWGDFIHTRGYWLHDHVVTDDVARTLSGKDLQHWLQEHFSIYSKYIFLTSLPVERLKDVIVFGSTIITNDAESESDETYYENFRRFFEGAGAVYFRDALSAAKISPLRNNEASLGCDCALLLQNADLEQLSGCKLAAERKGVGVFFGRTPSKLRMMILARVIGRHLGEKCSWISWLAWHSGQRRHRWPYMLLGYKIRSGHADTSFLLSQLSGYQYIITDTYHLCVNAWRMGIPAICIGMGDGVPTTTLSDKKKEIFYEMYGARQFYVFIESLRSFKTFFAEARRVAAVLQKKQVVSRVSANIAMHQEMAMRRLKNAMYTILSKK